MDPFLVPRQLLATIQAAPAPGIELLFSLVEAGVVSVHDPVDDAGASLMDALINGVFHGKSSVWRQGKELRAALFAPDQVQRWLQVSGGKAFSGRDQKGQWVVAALLENLTQDPPASKATRSRLNLPKQPTDDLWSGKRIDPWLARVLPLLPDQAWAEIGPSLMAHALKAELPQAIAIAWKKVPVLSLDAAGDPVLMSARSGRHWDRFLQEGGDPSTWLGNAPLWKKMLGVVLRKQPVSSESLTGRFEEWFLSTAPSDDEMRPHLKALLFQRSASAEKSPPQQWVKMFEAAGPESLRWETSKTKMALWKVACLAHPEAAAFDALESSKAIMRNIALPEFEATRLFSLVQQVAKASNEAQTERAFGLVEDHLSRRGWPQGVGAFAPLFAALPLPRPLRQRLLSKVSGNEEAWWGPADQRADLLRDLALGLPRVDRSAQQLDTWLEMLSVKGVSSPWLSVALGVASAMRGRQDGLEGVPTEDARQVLSDPEGSSLLLALSKAVPPRHRPHYLTWLESMTLAASAPIPTARRPSSRL